MYPIDIHMYNWLELSYKACMPSYVFAYHMQRCFQLVLQQVAVKVAADIWSNNNGQFDKINVRVCFSVLLENT